MRAVTVGSLLILITWMGMANGQTSPQPLRLLGDSKGSKVVTGTPDARAEARPTPAAEAAVSAKAPAKADTSVNHAPLENARPANRSPEPPRQMPPPVPAEVAETADGPILVNAPVVGSIPAAVNMPGSNQLPGHEADQVDGVITYTYYVGTEPTGEPLPGPPVDAGTYTVVATFRSAEGNFTGGSAATTFTIQKATPNIKVQNAGGTYNGLPFPVKGVALAPTPEAGPAVGPPPSPIDLAGVPMPATVTQSGSRPVRRSIREVVPTSAIEESEPPNAAAHRILPMTSKNLPRPPAGSESEELVFYVESGAVAPGGANLNLQPPHSVPKFWFNAEYLMWWVKGSPLPLPLVTTSTTLGTNLSGAMGQPGTTVLYGGTDVDFGLFSGLQITGGTWLDPVGWLGVEGRAFFLQNRSETFNITSNNAGSPALYLPAFNTQLQGERALVVADPVEGLAGNVRIESTSQLWGAEVNGRINLVRTNNLAIDLLAGFRYLDLDESFVLSNTTRDLTENLVDVLRDDFSTTNEFYGAVLGPRFSYTSGAWVFCVTEKIALGSTQGIVNIAGDITEAGAGAPSPGTFLGGFFAQPTNIGRHADNQFSVVSELELKVGYQFSQNFTAFLGYNFIYWAGVVRPGDQIDRNLNLSQSPIFGSTGGTLVGAPSPQPRMHRSDIWIQGLNMGLVFSY